MKYLKTFESFYSPAIQTYKGNIGTEETNDTGANTYQLGSFKIDDEKIAFEKGEKAFEKDINENPYIDQQYPNSVLIKAWESGWKNSERNKQIKEKIYIGLDGSMNYPDYLVAEDEDTIDIAFFKGEDAYRNDCDQEENPYTDIHQDMVTAWEDGYLNAKNNELNNKHYH